MASFEKPSSLNLGAGSTQAQKFPIKRLQLSINKFVKVLEIDLERLHRHRQNIERLTVQESWTTLNKEQINASRTVQQIKANVQEIEKARGQVIEDDLHIFDRHIEDIKLKAVKAIHEFLILSHSGNSSPLDELVVGPPCDQNELSTSPATAYGTYSTSRGFQRPSSPHDEILSCSLPNTSDISQIQISNVSTVNPETVASWQNLQEDLVDLNTMIKDYSTTIQEQGEKIDRIEDNISSAETEVREGTSYLGQASKYKAAIFPVAGILVGGALGGPIGLVAGLKLGGFAAASGAFAGFWGGHYIKKRKDQVTELELSNLSMAKSSSLDDIPSSTKNSS